MLDFHRTLRRLPLELDPVPRGARFDHVEHASPIGTHVFWLAEFGSIELLKSGGSNNAMLRVICAQLQYLPRDTSAHLCNTERR